MKTKLNQILTMKILLIVFLMLGSYLCQAQWSTNFESLDMKRVVIKGITSPEQAILISQIALQTENVLMARANSSGELVIFTEESINEELLKSRIEKINGVKMKSIKSFPSVKEEYLKAYTLIPYPQTEYITDKELEVFKFQDKQKEERAYSVAKKIWIELYPDTYQKLLPEPSELTEKEKREKSQKDSGMDMNSKSKNE